MSRTVENKKKAENFHTLFLSGNLKAKSSSELLSLAVKFAKIEQLYRELYGSSLIEKRIAVLASYTTHHLIIILKLFLYQQGIAPTFYEGEYDSIAVEIMDETSGLYSFQPNLLFILTYHTDIKHYPPLFSKDEDVISWIHSNKDYYLSLWQHALKVKGCQIFQTLFVSPLHRQLGNLESNYAFSKTNCIRALNIELARAKPSHVTLIDKEYFAGLFGKQYWFDEPNYFLSKQGFSLDAAGMVSYFYARLVSSQAGLAKKCLVLDLDNTLWGGVIGDDGLEGINLNPHHAVGEAYLHFQQYVKDLKERGIILSVASKNEEDIAEEPFRNHPDMILSLDDIACFKANWNPKSDNLREIANELNISLDSLVFFDDNPAEREIVKQFTPEVEVIDVPEDPSYYSRALEQSMCFEWPQLSTEDLSRADTYSLNIKRESLKTQFSDYNDYLKSLDMSAEVATVGPLELPRFSQLINKSNQFNLRTRRYSEGALKQMQEAGYELICVSLSDKFSNYGIISCLILHRQEDAAFIDTWVMSCRVLKRGVESVAFNHLCTVSKSLGYNSLIGEYLPTKKNRLVVELLPSLGFKEYLESARKPTEAEGVIYKFDLDNFTPIEHFININVGER